MDERLLRRRWRKSFRLTLLVVALAFVALVVAVGLVVSAYWSSLTLG
jgi:ABC-type lipoprotein release transport system permease subunit